MPVLNLTSGAHSPHKVFGAKTRIQRLLGFLALLPAAEPKVLFIRTCSGIHTFSMPEPLNIAFMDKSGVVLRLVEALPPGKIIPSVKGARSVLEWSWHSHADALLQVGDRLDVRIDAAPPGGAGAWRQFLHTPVNIMLALLWFGFVLSALGPWLGERTPTGLGLLIYNSLLAYLFLTRRPSETLSRNGLDWLVAISTVLLSFLLRPIVSSGGWLAHLSLVLQFCAILTVILALASLGKSFGIVPANRRIKVEGAYRIVRHPLYSAELLFLAAFLLGNPTLGNLGKSVLIAAGQFYRALAEERLLGSDPRYRAYLANVRFRFIPYIL
jgi:protein-S-isoprenylcysteine O-methyltransferase Ste14/uncharacterized membrane protein (UPF0127 family)